MSPRILRAADRVATSWRNGGGVTHEVAISPAGSGWDDFDWRVSLAEVSQAGPFSPFRGVDRVLTVLEGRLMLEMSGHEVRALTPETGSFAFAGDLESRGVPVDGPVLDLNLMVRRGKFAGEVRRLIVQSKQAVTAKADAMLFVALDPLRASWAGATFELGRLDALSLRRGDAVVMTPMAFVAQAISIEITALAAVAAP